MISIRSILSSASVALLLTLVSLYTAQALATPNESRLIQQGTAFQLGDDQNNFRAAAQMRESPDGRFVYALQLTSSQVLVFARDLTTGELSYRSRTSLTDLNIVNDMLFLAEGGVVAFLSYAQSKIGFYYRNEDTGALTLAENLDLSPSEYYRWGAAKSPDERFVYFTGESNLGTYVYEFQESPLSFTYVSHHDGPEAGYGNFSNTPRNFTQVSSDGLRFYVAAAFDQLIRVYDIDQTTGELGTYIDYPTPDARPLTILFSPDERHLYVGSQSRGAGESSLHIFDVDSATGGLSNFRTVNVPDVNLQLINSLAQTPDGKFIFAGNALNLAGTGVIWFERNADTGDLTFKLEIKDGVDDITGISPVWSLMASADNKNWYAASGNGTVGGISKFFTFQLASITLDLSEPQLNFIPNTPVRLAGDLSIDVDIPDNADTVDAAVVRISNGLEIGDLLSVTPGSGIVPAYNVMTGELNLFGTATAADYEAVLQTLELTALGDVNDSREVTIEVSYGSVVSNTLTVSLTLPTFTVRFLDWDGSLLQEETVQYGNDATAPASPTRDNHQFSGWDVGFAAVTSNLDVTAQYDINTFTVRFLDWDGGVLATQTVDWNTGATAPADPTRDGYTFSGWSVAFDVITANLDVTAEYDINTFTVRFLDWDGAELSSQTVNWNSGATAPADPTRDGYTFTGWSAAFDVITANLDVTAEYDINTFTVRFLDWDGAELSSQTVNWNTAATAPTDPTRDGYTFTGWSAAFDVITTNLDVTAEYDINTFTVRFLDWDGAELSSQTVDWNTAATAPTDPTRDGYTFTGWSAAFDVITTNLDVTAEYDINTFTVRFLDWDGAELSSQTADWNTAATAPADPTRDGYTFSGWDVGFAAVTSNLDVTAQYDINTFTVRFLDWDGGVLATQTVDWNTAATAPADPEREGYSFTGWSVAFDVIAANLDVTAEYDINTFTVRFLDWDDAELSSQTVNWNTAATAPADPERELYEFIGWDRAFDAVTSDMDITAQYERNAFVVTATVITVDGFGVVTPMVQQVPRGGTATFEAWTSMRYRIRSVQSDCGVTFERTGRTYQFDDIRQDCEVVFEYRKVRSSIIRLLKMHGAVIQEQDDEMPGSF